MSNLTTFAGANYTVPLIPSAYEPAFCTASTNSVVFIWSHNKQFVGQLNMSGGEYWSSGQWQGNWSGTPSSNSSWQYAGTSQAGPHGHNYLSITPGYDTNQASAVYYTQGFQNGGNYLYGGTNSRTTGVWVNKTKRDNLCIQQANSVASSLFRTQISSLGYGALMSPMLSTGDMTGGTTVGVSNGYNTYQTMGLVGYNETTKMWVVGQQTASDSGALRMYVYKNIPAPSMTTNLGDAYWSNFNQSTKIAIDFSISPNGTFDTRSWKIIPLDNGNIVVISKQSSGYIQYLLFTGNNGVDSTSWTAGTPVQLGTTTSLNSQTWQDNLPAFVTYDGKYVFVCTQYYYYYSGIVGFLVRVSDGKRLYISHTDTSYSMNPVMIGDNKMIISYGQNSDGGTGQALYEYDIGYLMDVYANDTNVTSYYVNTYIDNPSSSTCYPMIWTMPSPLPRFNKGVI